MSWAVFVLAAILLIGLATFAGALVQLLADCFREEVAAHKFKRRRKK